MATSSSSGGMVMIAERQPRVVPWSWGADWWRSPAFDVIAFAVGLAAAWRGGWTVTDLVWSLWLSSLVVGYAIIVWTIARPIVDVARGMTREAGSIPPGGALLAGSFLFLGGLFALAFFTVHFGMFHYVHSQFLATFFPLDGNGSSHGFVGLSTYLVVLRRYWGFLPAAFLAERGAFMATPPLTSASTPAGAPGARRATTGGGGGAMFAPYRNVVRMHLLIFFFAFAHFARLDGFAVYAVVYAVYFFPWRLVRKER